MKWWSGFCCLCLFWIVGLPTYSQEEKENKDNPEINLQEFILEIEKYKDPFIPLVGTATSQTVARIEKLKLEGIVWSATNPLAVINGEILKPGDEIEEAIVERIEKDRVFLSYNNKTFSLVFWEEEGEKSEKRKKQ